MSLFSKKIGYRLGLGFGLLIVFIIIDSGLGLLNLKSVTTQTSNIYNHPFTVSTAILRVDGNIIRMHRSMKDVALARDKRSIEVAIQSVNELEKRVFDDLDIVHERFLGDKKRVDKLRVEFSNWKLVRDEVIALMRRGEREKAAEITKNKGAKYVQKLIEHVEEFVSFAKNKADSFYENAQKSQKSALLNSTIITSWDGVFRSNSGFLEPPLYSPTHQKIDVRYPRYN